MPVATKRNPTDEARIRSLLMMGVMNARMIASFTKSTQDDKDAERWLGVLMDQQKWDLIAEIIWGE